MNRNTNESKKGLLQGLIKQREKAWVYDISTDQYQSSSGLLGQLTNLQNIYVVK